MSTPSKLTPSSSGMKPRVREASVNWIMVIVLMVVAFGILLLVTGEFGTV